MDDAGSPDGGAGSDASLVAAPAPPEIPWLAADGTAALPIAPPALTPCPPGWRGVTSDTGVTSCDPWPEGGPRDCPVGEAHFPGEPGCARIGSACPTGDFPDDLPDDGSVLYVLEGATGGDGSRAAPFGRIADALGAIDAAVTTIAVGPGRYDGAVSLPPEITLRGACVSETLVTAAAGDTPAAVVNLMRGRAEVRDLRIGESGRIGVFAQGAGVELSLRGVAVDRATLAAVIAGAGATVAADEVVLASTAPHPSALTFGRGLEVHAGAHARATRVVIVQNHDYGVFANGTGASVSLADVAVRGTLPRSSDGDSGRGAGAEDGATMTIDRSVLEANRDVALLALGLETSLVLADVVVRGTLSTASRTGGRGLAVHGGATAEAHRVVFEDNRDAAVVASLSPTFLRLEDVIIRRTQPNDRDGTGGHGLVVQVGAAGEAERLVVERSHDIGILVSMDRASLVLVDGAVRDTLPRQEDALNGVGLAVRHGATGRVESCLFERNRDVSIYVDRAGSSVALVDVAVLDTLPEEGGVAGRAINVQEGANASATRVLVERSHAVGMFAGEGATLVVSDAVVRDTLEGRGLGVETGSRLELARVRVERAHEIGLFAADAGTVLAATDLVVTETALRADGTLGRGIDVQEGVTGRIERALFERSRQLGVYASGNGTSLELADIVSRHTLPAECPAERCPAGGGGGIGIGCYQAAHLSVSRFLLADNALCGLHVASDGELDLADGEVRQNPVGACVQVAGYDVARLTSSVQYVDNMRSVETTTLPVPEMGMPLDGLGTP